MMTIKETGWNNREYEQNIPQYVKNQLTNAGYDSGGAVEQAQQAADKTAECLGRLLEYLMEHGMKQEDFCKVVGIYDQDRLTFTNKEE